MGGQTTVIDGGQQERDYRRKGDGEMREGEFHRDVSGDTIRQLIRGRHNSAIRGYDRLWI